MFIIRENGARVMLDLGFVGSLVTTFPFQFTCLFPLERVHLASGYNKVFL